MSNKEECVCYEYAGDNPNCPVHGTKKDDEVTVLDQEELDVLKKIITVGRNDKRSQASWN